MSISVVIVSSCLYLTISVFPFLAGDRSGLNQSAGWISLASVTIIVLEWFPEVWGDLVDLGKRAWRSLSEPSLEGLITIAACGGFAYLLAEVWRVHGMEGLSGEPKPRDTRSDKARLASYQARLRGEIVTLEERKKLTAEREERDCKNARRRTKKKEREDIVETSQSDYFLPRKDQWPVDLLWSSSVEQQMHGSENGVPNLDELVIAGFGARDPVLISPADVRRPPERSFRPLAQTSSAESGETLEDRFGLNWERWFEDLLVLNSRILPIKLVGWWLTDSGALEHFSQYDPEESRTLPATSTLQKHDSTLYTRCVSVTRPDQIRPAISLIQAAVSENPYYNTEWLNGETSRNQFRNSVAVDCEFETFPGEFLMGRDGSFYNKKGNPIYDPQTPIHAQLDIDRRLVSIMTVAVDRVLVVNFHILCMLTDPVKPGHMANRRAVGEVKRIFSELIFNTSYYKFWFNPQTHVAAMEATLEHMYRSSEGRPGFCIHGRTRKPKYKSALTDDTNVFNERPPGLSFHPAPGDRWEGPQCPYNFHSAEKDPWGRPCPCRSNNIDLCSFTDFILRGLGYAREGKVTDDPAHWCDTRYICDHESFQACMLWQDRSAELLRKLKKPMTTVLGDAENQTSPKMHLEEDDFMTWDPEAGSTIHLTQEFESDARKLGNLLSGVVGIALIVRFLATTESPRLLAERLSLYGQLRHKGTIDRQLTDRGPSRPLPAIEPSHARTPQPRGIEAPLYIDNKGFAPADLLDWRLDYNIINHFGFQAEEEILPASGPLHRRQIFSFMLSEPNFGEYVIHLRYAEEVDSGSIQGYQQIGNMLEQLFKHDHKRQYMVEAAISQAQVKVLSVGAEIAGLDCPPELTGDWPQVGALRDILLEPTRSNTGQRTRDLVMETLRAIDALDLPSKRTGMEPQLPKDSRGDFAEEKESKKYEDHPGYPLRSALRRLQAGEITYDQVEDYFVQFWVFRVALDEKQNEDSLSRARIVHDLMFNPVLYYMPNLREKLFAAIPPQEEELQWLAHETVQLSWDFDEPPRPNRWFWGLKGRKGGWPILEEDGSLGWGRGGPGEPEELDSEDMEWKKIFPNYSDEGSTDSESNCDSEGRSESTLQPSAGLKDQQPGKPVPQEWRTAIRPPKGLSTRRFFGAKDKSLELPDNGNEEGPSNKIHPTMQEGNPVGLTHECQPQALAPCLPLWLAAPSSPIGLIPQPTGTEDTPKTQKSSACLGEYSLEGDALEYTAAELEAGMASDRLRQFVRLRTRWGTLFTFHPPRETEEQSAPAEDLWKLFS